MLWFGIFCRISLDLLTDFRNLFTIWKSFTCRWWNRTLFSNLSRDVAMEIKQCCRNEGKMILRAFFARSPDGRSVLFCYYLLQMPISYKNFGEDRSSSFGVERFNRWKLCCNSASIWRSLSLWSLSIRRQILDRSSSAFQHKKSHVWGLQNWHKFKQGTLLW